MKNLTAPVSLGELIDKISILFVKYDKIKDEEKKAFVRKEINALTQYLETEIIQDEDTRVQLYSFIQSLKEVNSKLWDIEDRIRILEKKQDFGEEFVSTARSVYFTNDERFAIKNHINDEFQSELREVKDYEDYK